MSGGNFELWPDLRALNSGERDKFNLFWEAAERVLAALESCAADNRHGNERTLMQPISVPDFRWRVVEQLQDDGHADAEIPSDDWIGFQFQPRCPTRDLAARYTGRWDITLKVLAATRRKFNVRAARSNPSLSTFLIPPPYARSGVRARVQRARAQREGVSARGRCGART